MARKPKPTLLKVVQGTARKCRMNPLEPTPSGQLSKAPEWLSESQKAGWDYAIYHAPAGLLTSLDRSALTIWVVAEDIYREACKKLQISGLTVVSPNGIELQSPHLPIINRQAVLMLKASSELGFNPTSRSKITVPVQSNENDPWKRLAESIKAVDNRAT